MRLAPCTTLHLSTWRSQGWKFCLLSLVSACFGDHELLEGQGLASQDHCCFLHAHPPPKKKKKIQGNTGSGGAAVEWMQFTAENANTALFGASVS